MLVIGRKPILETLKFHPGSINKIIFQEGMDDKKLNDIIKIAKQKGIILNIKSKLEFRKIFNDKDKSEGISQGVVAISEEFRYSDFDKIIKQLRYKKNGLLIILDEIQDPHNLGAIIRTSAAADADAVVISEKNSAKVTHTVIKSSAGAVNVIPIIQVKNIYKMLSALKANEFKVIGTGSKAERLHYEYQFPIRCAVVFGNEGYGIRKNILKLCDDIINIPLGDKVQSLNVSVAAGILLYEILRQRTRS